MPRNRQPRKIYRARAARVDAIQHAIDRVATLSDEQRAALGGPMQRAFEAFRAGQGNANAWADLADAMNVGEALAELSIAANLNTYFSQAQAALAAVHARHAGTGSWTLRGPEITALDDAVWAATVQLQHCSQGEMHDAITTVKRRMAAALAGSAAPGTTVCVGLLTDTPHPNQEAHHAHR